MIKKLALLNIAFAVLYFLFYLMNSYSYALCGIFMVILYSGVLLKQEASGKGFNRLSDVCGLACVIFAGFLLLWVFNLLRSSLQYNYFQNTWFYMLFTTSFAASILTLFIKVCTQRYKKEPNH